jgi:hypothetical protein
VFSVTSDTAANLSLQSAPSRSAKADPTPAPDSFSALIDSNAGEPAHNERPVAVAPDRPSPQQRPDDTSAAPDSRQPRDTATSSKVVATTASGDAKSNDAQSVAADGSADAVTASKPKLGSAKSGIVKTAVKDAASEIIAAPDTATSANPAASPQPDASMAVTPAPIAVAIAAPVAATSIVVAPASPGNTTEPLAIAAAAIATSASTVEATKPAASPAQSQTAPATDPPANPAPAEATSQAGTLATVATAATISPDVTDPAATAVNAMQPTANDPVAAPVSQPAAKADAAAQADPELAAAVAAATPLAAVVPKATSKAPTAARASESATPVKTGITADVADPSVASPATDATGKTAEPQRLVMDSNQKADDGAANAVKAGTTNTDSPTAAATAPNEHHTSATAQIQTDTPDAGQQAANAVQQPQLQSGATPAAATLTVTAAASAAVPLNGLALQIAVSAQSGKSRFEIRLDPVELGRIDVRIDVDRHGQVTSHLTVEKPETLAMLRQDAPQLQRALDNAGFKTGDSGLQFSLRDQSSSGQNAGDETGRDVQRLVISEDDTIPAAVAGRTYGRMLGSSGGVDIRV